VLRSKGAWLAVLLLSIPIVFALRSAARATDYCEVTPTGIVCHFAGTTTSTSITTLPPLRYLATMTHPTVGLCWFWSRFPPGIDLHDPANEHEVIMTRAAHPECPARDGGHRVDTTSRAWSVFRSWELSRPGVRIRPTVGITNLASVLTAAQPPVLRHRERLPDGRDLEVEGRVAVVTVDWGDGSPPVGYPPATVFGPGAAHRYRLKTCPPWYRVSHPAGRNCHPTLDAYPVTVTFEWQGRYRTGESWIVLGTIRRATSFTYDVDEVVGIPVAR
jgi:hypothetical protein